LIVTPIHEDFDISVVGPHRRRCISTLKALELLTPIVSADASYFAVYLVHMN
jgi:hypothetical protein